MRLHNTHTYDILANPHYVNHFQYISASIGASKREKMIIDSDTDEENNAVQSDLVRICLNLAFLPEHRGKAFQYSKDRLAKETTKNMENFKKKGRVQEDAN